MRKPGALKTDQPQGPWNCRGCDIWDALVAAESGDVEALRRLLELDPNLYRAEYWYTQPIDFAVREGHLDAVRVLLEAGADPGTVALDGDNLLTRARDRGHAAVVQLLEEFQRRRGVSRSAEPPVDRPIHLAVSAGDVERVRELLDADADDVHWRDGAGGTPLHRAVARSDREMMTLLLDRGADIHAVHGAGPGTVAGYPAVDFQAIDLALWTNPFWNLRGDLQNARWLVEHGAAFDLVIAAALGDQERVRSLLDEDPERIAATRPNGKRALSSAVEFGHEAIVRLLLERGADPNWPEGSTAPRGVALHAAARTSPRSLVELLLEHGADPNGYIDSSGSATYVARTPEIRGLMFERGGRLDTSDLIWLDEDEEAVRRVAEDPAAANEGCGGALGVACTRGKRDLLVRLLEAGARVPPVLTGCRSFLWSDPDLLQLLLDSGMNPDLPNWLGVTPMHDLSGRDSRGRRHQHRLACAILLLDAGATISARDEEYRSTPLAWAARCHVPDMAELLLARGAPSQLPDDEPWATPLSWATRRGHDRMVEILRQAS